MRPRRLTTPLSLQTNQRWHLISVLLGLLLALMFFTPRPVSAATIIVTNTNDSGPGSLRQLLADAAPGDTITFAASLSGQTIVLSTPLTIDKDLTIDGSTLPTPITLSGNQRVLVLSVRSPVTTTLLSLVIADGQSNDTYPTHGSGIYNAGILTLINTTVRNHVSQIFWDGGTIYNDVNAQLFVRNSSFLQNKTSYYGGAIYNAGLLQIDHSLFAENQAKVEFFIYPEFPITGGAIYNSGQITVTNSTFISNTVVGAGGAIANVSGIATIQNSTFEHNSSSKRGGALLNQKGTMTINHSTINGNRAAQGGGIANTGTLHLLNTIIANSRDGKDCWSEHPLLSNRHNLMESGNCAAFLTSDPILGALATYDGSTLTHTLLPGSPALDKGDSATCLATDQRGQLRPVDTKCDIGAFEGYTTTPVPEIEVEGNGYSIANGALTPQRLDQTDFGTRTVLGTQITTSFTIHNQGTDELVNLAVQLVDASTSFTIVEQPSVFLSPGHSSTVQIAFTAQTLGLHKATVAISSNDSDETPYTFTIQAYYCHDTITVNSAAGAGPESVAAAIDNICPGGMITFAPALSGATIALSHTLTMTKDIVMDGRMLPIPITLSGQGQRRVAEVSAAATVTIAGVTIANGRVPITTDIPWLPDRVGAGLRNDGNLTLTAVTFKNNVVEGGWKSGGSSSALYNSGVVTISESLFQTNTATNGQGGAIKNDGQMVITNSSFISNTIFHNAGGRGGAIYNAATLVITNSTFSYNIAYSAHSLAYGGAIDNDGTLRIYHSTFSHNQVTPYYGGPHSQGGGIANHGTLHLYNTIIANSVDTNDCTGIPTTNINNLIEDGTCESAIYGDPGLGILADHGGGTLTYDLVHGSAAIDRGDSRFCPATDQRGVARPVDGDSNGSALCDIGAYEAPPGPPITATVPPLPTRTPTGTPTPTWTPAPTATPRPTYTYTPTPTKTATAVSTATKAPAASPTPSPTITYTPTVESIFAVQVYVHTPTQPIQVGETFTVAVTVDNQSTGCTYPVYDLTLTQVGDPIFRFDSPAKIGPPVESQTVYTLTAVAPGTVALQATAYGERYCGDFWQWTYVTGATGPINITGPLTATATDSPTITPTATATQTATPTPTPTTQPPLTNTPTLTVTATPATLPRLGDGNGDQVVDKADVSACVQEIFDGDGVFWQDAPGSGYPGTVGCDANQDTFIDAGDIVCAILLMFQGPGACQASARQTNGQPIAAQLTLGSNTTAVAGQPFLLPVRLTTNGHAVAAVAFVLHFDPSHFTLGPTDNNGDKLADAVAFALPPLASQPFITMTQTADTLSVFLTDIAAPPAAFSDGTLLTVTLTTKPLDNTPVTSELTFMVFTPPSLGSQSGQSLPVQVVGSTVTIVPAPQRLYLPLIQAQ